MDTIFLEQALQAYRDKTEDMRPWESLPVVVASEILRDAQRRKSLRALLNVSGSQPAAADGGAES